jgi:hypothetical protein
MSHPCCRRKEMGRECNEGGTGQYLRLGFWVKGSAIQRTIHLNSFSGVEGFSNRLPGA